MAVSRKTVLLVFYFHSIRPKLLKKARLVKFEKKKKAFRRKRDSWVPF